MTAHARYFQASSAARWMSCPASVRLSDGLPDESSAYADEGTLAHELAAAILLGQPVGHAEASMHESVMDYVNAVRASAGGHAIMVEQRVDFSEAIGQPGSFGTADAIVIAGDQLRIYDLKYGMGVRVDAEENPQLQLYALGALHQYEMLGPFKTVRMAIHQVRLNHMSEWVVSVDDLAAFAARARAAAEEALSETATFLPGEKQCRWCKAKAHCPALAETVAEMIGQSFENLDAEELASEPDRVGLNYLSHCMSAVGLVEDWCKGIRSRVERELLAGNTIDGWKLVQGRKGARKWSSEADAEAALKRMRLKVDDIFDYRVISPTAAERLAKQGVIGARQWPQLEALISQSEGGLSVAPASDKRPAVTPVASPDDFEAVA